MTKKAATRIAYALALAFGVAAHAQTPAPASPPVLSTAPTPPPGVPMDPSQMSGFPLQVGDLPPGIVAVRVIRKSFAENISGQPVELQVAGTGKVLKATTGADGRAQFGAVSVGDTVHARAEVGTEALESQRFQLPAQGGVRLVLVAGVGAGVPVGSQPASPAPVAADVPAAVSSTMQRTKIAVPLGLAFVGLGTGWFWRFRRARRIDIPRRDASTDADSGSDDPIAQRASVFDRLLRLEQDWKAGVVASEVYAATREELIETLVELDTRLSAPFERVSPGGLQPEGGATPRSVRYS